MNKKLDGDAVKPAAPAQPSAEALAAAKETKEIGVQLQRIALRLAELGHSKAGSEALRAAVRCGRVAPGKTA